MFPGFFNCQNIHAAGEKGSSLEVVVVGIKK